MKKYRYILSGLVSFDNPISYYRLIANNNMGDIHNAIRVSIPDDMILTKYSCDSYSTTDDQRLLKDLETDVVIKINGKWIIDNQLKKYQPHEYEKGLQELYPEKKYRIAPHTYASADRYQEFVKLREKELQTEYDRTINATIEKYVKDNNLSEYTINKDQKRDWLILWTDAAGCDHCYSTREETKLKNYGDKTNPIWA